MRHLLLLLPLLVGCPKAAVPVMEPDATVTYTTAAGWQGELRRYQADGPPVLLVHGMGANHRNWDFAPEVSMVDDLVADDWDVWVVTLPGDDQTVPPDGLTHDDVTFDDTVEDAIPAILDAVTAETGAERVHWVGHSMGGMLLYSSLDDPRIASGVAICSPGQFHEATFWARKGSKGRLDGEIRSREGLARRWAWTAPFNPVLGLAANRRHVDGAVAKGLLHHAVDDTPAGVSAQTARWIHGDGELRTTDGDLLVDFDAEVPILAFGGTRDRVVSDEDVAATCARLADCRYVELRGYGHVDPVLGTTAEGEVTPTVLAWLADHRDR